MGITERKVCDNMRLIDADAMIDRLKEWDTKDKTDKALYNFTLNRINEQPTIQLEIVQCKDCKYHHKRICPIERYFSLDGFCSRGKRREVTT